MKKLTFLFLALITTTALWASNVITYKATKKLPESTSEWSSGLHTNAFNVAITSHEFADSIGTITFAGEVTSIGKRAFYSCYSLTTITIPNSVTSIGDDAFWGCTSLPVVDNLRYADTYLIGAVDKTLSTYTIKDGTKWIGSSAFDDCSSLTSITIPNSVTSIGYGAFSGCTSLPVVDNLRYADTYLIEAVDNVSTYTIKDGTKWIKSGAFRYCSSLTSITIPNSVISIGSYAFDWCTSLTSITIGNSVTSIGDGAFSSCDSLTSIDVDAANTHYASVDGVLFNYAKDTLIKYPVGNTRTTYTIPNSVTSIGEGVFSSCTSLTSINVDAANTHYTSTDGVLFNYAKDTLIQYPIGNTRAEYTIPNSVTSIGDGAFSNCTSLTSITIPNSVTSIGWFAFSDCTSLTSITIPNSVTSIGYGAFNNCTSLTSITIPNSVTNVGNYAFYDCTSLTSITCYATTPPICGGDCFTYVDKSIPLYVPKNSITAYQQAVKWKDFTNIKPIIIGIVTTSVNDPLYGSVSGGGEQYDTICTLTLTAIANYGCHFTQWSDGNTDNPRSIIFTQDTTFEAIFDKDTFAITTDVNYPERGITKGDTSVLYLDTITISATANYGYHFTQWNDGNTSNPRQVYATENTTYTAQFDKNTYTITKIANSTSGQINGSSSSSYLDEITLTASANYGYHFSQWSDSVTDNPRSIVLTQDTTFEAWFDMNYSGQCGDNLFWQYCNGQLTIAGSGAMYNEMPWFLFADSITQVNLPNKLTTIGAGSFQNMVNLNSIIIPASVTNVGAYAFSGCRKLFNIYCYAIQPPYAQTSSFENYNVYLRVPCDNLRDYQMDAVFGSFKYIECNGAEPTTTTTVTVTPTDNTATITWPTSSDAADYTIEIKKDGEVFCTLTFNAQGQLTNIAFAPGRGTSSDITMAEVVAGGYKFTITSLTPGTTYTYVVDTKNAGGKSIANYIGTFATTGGATSINQLTDSPTDRFTKIIKDGQLLILRDAKIYNAQGTEVK